MTEQHDPHAAAVVTLARAMWRTAAIPGVVVVVAAAAVAALAAGSAGFYGALIGGGVATAASLLTIGLMRFSAGLPVMMVMLVAVGGYALKMVALLVVMVALGGVPGLDVLSLAVAFLVTVLTWVVAEVVAFKRVKIPTLVLSGNDR